MNAPSKLKALSLGAAFVAAAALVPAAVRPDDATAGTDQAPCGSAHGRHHAAHHAGRADQAMEPGHMHGQHGMDQMGSMGQGMGPGTMGSGPMSDHGSIGHGSMGGSQHMGTGETSPSTGSDQQADTPAAPRRHHAG